jgi:hypothetical protein
MKSLLAAGALAASVSAPAMAAVFADSASTADVSFFGSGSLVGPPDNGGAFLSNTFDPPDRAGSITWGFSGGLTTGAGIDLILYEIGARSEELFKLEISKNGLMFQFAGEFDTLTTSFDLDALGFSGPFSFVRVTNAGRVNSPEFDTAEGVYALAPIPLPAALPLLLAALAGLGAIRRRHP